MRVFVTGATGFVGSAVVAELQQAGHEVLGLARSERSAAALADTGAQVHRGELHDLDSLRSGAEAADGVIHCAFIHDFSQPDSFRISGEADLAAVEAIGAQLAGSGRPFAITSGTGLTAPGRLATEADRVDPDSTPMFRVRSEWAAFALAERDVRSSVVRLPPTVHGEGDHGFVPMLIEIARAKGFSAHVGDGEGRWPAVHRRDAARLFRLAVESATGGEVLHGIAEEGVPTREIAETIGRHLGVPVRSIAAEQAAEHFGFLGTFLSLDLPASSERTRELLGWQPAQPGLIEDLEQGHYFAAAAAGA